MNTNSTPPQNHLSIKVHCKPRYKSIELVDWNDIPAFAILTGLNGSGKSQLLELLAFRLPQSQFPLDWIPDEARKAEVSIVGDTFGPHDVVYIPAAGAFADSFDVPPPSVAS